MDDAYGGYSYGSGGIGGGYDYYEWSGWSGFSGYEDEDDTNGSGDGSDDEGDVMGCCRISKGLFTQTVYCHDSHTEKQCTAKGDDMLESGHWNTVAFHAEDKCKDIHFTTVGQCDHICSEDKCKTTSTPSAGACSQLCGGVTGCAVEGSYNMCDVTGKTSNKDACIAYPSAPTTWCEGVEGTTTATTTTAAASTTTAAICLKKGDSGQWTCPKSGGDASINCDYVCDDYTPADCPNGEDEDASFCAAWTGKATTTKTATTTTSVTTKTTTSTTTTATTVTTTTYKPGSCEVAACGSRIPAADCADYKTDHGDFARLHCPLLCGLECSTSTTLSTSSTTTTTTTATSTTTTTRTGTLTTTTTATTATATTTTYSRQSCDGVLESELCGHRLHPSDCNLISDAGELARATCQVMCGIACTSTSTSTATATSTTTTTTTATSVTTTTATVTSRTTTTYIPQPCHEVHEAFGCGNRIPKSDCTLFGDHGDFAREHCPTLCGLPCTSTSTTTTTTATTTTTTTATSTTVTETDTTTTTTTDEEDAAAAAALASAASAAQASASAASAAARNKMWYYVGGIGGAIVLMLVIAVAVLACTKQQVDTTVLVRVHHQCMRGADATAPLVFVLPRTIKIDCFYISRSPNFLSFPFAIYHQAATNSYANPAYEHAQHGPQAPYIADAGHGSQVDAMVNPVYAVGNASHEENHDC